MSLSERDFDVKFEQDSDDNAEPLLYQMECTETEVNKGTLKLNKSEVGEIEKLNASNTTMAKAVKNLDILEHPVSTVQCTQKEKIGNEFPYFECQSDFISGKIGSMRLRAEECEREDTIRVPQSYDFYQNEGLTQHCQI